MISIMEIRADISLHCAQYLIRYPLINSQL